jgi:hypothetical protein
MTRAARVALAALALAGGAGLPRTALAHRLDVVVTLGGGGVVVEVFEGGYPAKRVVLEVRGASGIARGHTDDDGRMSFSLERPSDLSITVDPDGPHRFEVEIEAKDMAPHFAAGGPSTPVVLADTRGDRWIERVPAWARAVIGVAAIAAALGLLRFVSRTPRAKGRA